MVTRPYVIFDDADLDEAVDGLIASKFRNAGQTCVCANRTYVQSGIYDEFVRRLAEKVTKMIVGRGTREGVTIGPLIDERAVDKADEHVQDAVSHGARLVTGGERLTEGEYAHGSFYAPTVLEGVTPDMLISTEETFGPVAGITRFETEEEAIRARQRHRLRARRVLPHARLRAAAARRGEARVRDHRRQLRHHQRGERPVRRRQGVGLRARGRCLRHRRVPRRQVRARRGRGDLTREGRSRNARLS